MDRQILLRKIMGVNNEVRRLEQDISALQSIDVIDYPDSYSTLSYNIAIRGENVLHKLRKLVYDTTNISKTEYHNSAADMLGIRVKEDNGVVEIALPCLLPKRKNRSNGFITGPLSGVLSQFILDKQEPFNKFEHCVICITHVYDKKLINRRRIRDHDNMELKDIIDTINMFLLTDDTGSLCDIYSTSKVADDDFTLISIMGKDLFPKWILRHKNGLKSISQNL